MHTPISRICIGCGRPVGLLRYRERKGPFCEKCLVRGAPVKSDYWYPTAFSSWGPEEQGAIERVIASNQFTMGPEVKAFEEEFALYHGKRHGVMVNSGSSANLIMVAALIELDKIIGHEYEEPDNAFVPALAWSTTYAPFIQYGLDLALLDCDESWNINPESTIIDPVRNVPRYEVPSLIVGCSIFGNPARLDLISAKARELGAIFIEDNCESLGATINGKLCGTFGFMSSFSFFHSHQISAIEGGMILTDDEEAADMCRMLRAHGWTRDVRKASSFEEEYDFRVMGYNVRPLELHAAIAREQLKKLPGFINARQDNLVTFWRLTEGLPLIYPSIQPNPSPFGLHFEVSSKEARNRVVGALRDAGIDARLPTGGSFRKHPYGARWANQATPRADLIHDRGLFLGNGPFDLTEKITKAVEVLRGVL